MSAFTEEERKQIAEACAYAIRRLETAGLRIEHDREGTLVSLDAAAAQLGSLVAQLNQGSLVPCAKCDRGDGRLGHADGCPKGDS